jgi:hypothetical protein
MEVSEWYSLCFHVGNAPIYPNLSCCLLGWVGFLLVLLLGLLYSFLTFIMVIYMGFIQA